MTVVEIGSRAEIEYAARRGEDVAGRLKRHWVCAAANALVASEEPFEALEALLLQSAADLVVVGAYGHSRVQEWIFGGVTRNLLTKARCCCLLAHKQRLVAECGQHRIPLAHSANAGYHVDAGWGYLPSHPSARESLRCLRSF